MTWQQLFIIGWHCSNFVLLVDFHVVIDTTKLLVSSCVLLIDCIIVIETMEYYSSYRWHGSSNVLLVDCRVVNGLLDEDIVKRYLPR
jgi:hypothetical protein